MDVSASLTSPSWEKAPELWELRVFLWTSADWPAWHEVMLDLDPIALQVLEGSVFSQHEDRHSA
jgi:hypothetical protein